VVGWVTIAIRRLYFHPLSRFPGPRLAAISNVPYCLGYLGGRQPWKMLDLHKRYGRVVRISPTELSFDTAQSWKDIYGQRKGHLPFIKSAFYDGGNFADQAHSIVSERDPTKHADMRRYLSNAFSDRSLREQEHLISSNVDAFIKRIGELGSKPEGINLTLWFNLLTFDIIGNLAFGQTFGGIESGKTHTWIQVVLESMGQASLSDTLGRFPWLARLYMKWNPGWLDKLMSGAEKHQSYTLTLLRSRLSQNTDRKDFMSYLMKEDDHKTTSEIQLAAHASDFVIAGSETTATTLAVIVYYMCAQQDIMQKLQQEIRSSFQKFEDIDSMSTANLRYLQAVCMEGLRIIPPLPLGLPRVVPPGGDTVDGEYIPAGTIVSTNPMAATLSEKNFANPKEFDPERWMLANTTDKLEASQPFSHGTRACLGRGLGLMELRTVLTKMLFKYNITMKDPTLDWHQESEMQLLWKKPALKVKITSV
ncbi:putative cytochrome P450, partial [Pyrenochaeta sp. MPI-SDFR-AT-0127]